MSVKQPWAELEAAGWKGVEVRSVPTHHRGQLAVHASLRYDAGPDALSAWMEYRLLRDSNKATQEIRALPVGRVVAVVNLADCRPLEKADEASACAPWRPNAWAWRFADVKRADTGIPVKGQLGLWTIPDAWITVEQETKTNMTDPPCPSCGEPDPDKPCLGSEGTKDGVRRPLPYRHSGRVPPRKGNPRLDGPLTPGGLWDTEALR